MDHSAGSPCNALAPSSRRRSMWGRGGSWEHMRPRLLCRTATMDRRARRARQLPSPPPAKSQYCTSSRALHDPSCCSTPHSQVWIKPAVPATTHDPDAVDCRQTLKAIRRDAGSCAHESSDPASTILLAPRSDQGLANQRGHPERPSRPLHHHLSASFGRMETHPHAGRSEQKRNHDDARRHLHLFHQLGPDKCCRHKHRHHYNKPSQYEADWIAAVPILTDTRRTMLLTRKVQRQ